MSGLYAIVEGATKDRTALIWPALSKSRESFSTTLVLTNVFYLTPTRETAEEVTKNLETIEGTIPVMMDLADNDLQRGALGALGYRAVSWRLGIAQLSRELRDPRAAAARGDRRQPDRDGERDRPAVQQHARARADAPMSASSRRSRRIIYVRIAIVAVLSLSISILIGLGDRAEHRAAAARADERHAARSSPATMRARSATSSARDEIGEMARAVEVFRENAIAKRQAEIELKASKERAEKPRCASCRTPSRA